mmetsp:Transcript_18406/g.62651  ORF Transcript_18406/g.62651 Transcript_18406/m.62651 type:complete len:404 (+) Transcript_18406:2-1213(+)
MAAAAAAAGPAAWTGEGPSPAERAARWIREHPGEEKKASVPGWEVWSRPSMPPDWECVPHPGARGDMMHDDGRFDGVCARGSEGGPHWLWHDKYVPAGAPAASAAELAAVLAGKRVAVVGDSLVSQLFQALECEAEREGVAEGMVDLGWAAEHMPTAIKVQRVSSSRGPATFGYRGDRTLVAEGALEKLEKLVAESCDVCIVNIGVHYNDMGEYREAMGRLVPVLERHADPPRKAVLFLESSAQHFAGTLGTGAYAQRYQDAGEVCSCGPITAAGGNALDPDERNAIVRGLLPRGARVELVPFFNLSMPRWDTHHMGATGYPVCDCTHQCYSPPYYRLAFAALKAAACEALAGPKVADSDVPPDLRDACGGSSLASFSYDFRAFMPEDALEKDAKSRNGGGRA